MRPLCKQNLIRILRQEAQLTKIREIILSQKSKGYPGIQGNVYFNSFKFLAIRTPILITAR